MGRGRFRLHPTHRENRRDVLPVSLNQLASGFNRRRRADVLIVHDGHKPIYDTPTLLGRESPPLTQGTLLHEPEIPGFHAGNTLPLSHLIVTLVISKR